MKYYDRDLWQRVKGLPELVSEVQSKYEVLQAALSAFH